MSEAKRTPKLRFPEFSGEWEEKEFKNIKSQERFAIVDGPFGTQLHADEYLDAGNPVVRINNTSYSGKFLLKNLVYISSDKAKELKRSKVIAGDVIIAKTGATIGKSAIYPEKLNDGIIASSCLKITLNKSIACNRFVLLFITSYFGQNQILKYASGSTRNTINIGDLEVIKLNLPSVQEQTKIANFLASIDSKIEQLSAKQELLIEYKKGLMQKIFNQAIRFKADDGSDFTNWEEMKLGDIGSFYRGHSYNSTNVKDEGLLVLRSSNIKNDSLVLDKDLQFVNLDCSENISLRAKDIVICMANGSKKLVGKSAMYYGNYTNKLTVGAFCSIFRTNNLLSKHLLQTVKYRKYLHISLAGTNINNLKNSELAELKFNLPSSNVEQEKIANLLSSIDSKIEQIGKQLDETKQFKKALLQQMFV
jgi:type I restriction enzyme, S subunit